MRAAKSSSLSHFRSAAVRIPLFMPRLTSRKKLSASSMGMSYTSGKVTNFPPLRGTLMGSGFSSMSPRSETLMTFFGLSLAIIYSPGVSWGRWLRAAGVSGLGGLLVGLPHSLGAGLLLGVPLPQQRDALDRVAGFDAVLTVFRHETGHGETPVNGW